VPGQGRVAITSRIRVPRVHDRAGALRLTTAGRRLRSTALLVLLSAGIPGSAAGHDGITGVFVEPDLVNPGGVIVVRGDNVSTDDPVWVDLVVGTNRLALAATATDGEGHFTIGATVPTDLVSGTYAIEVNSASGIRMTDWLQVDGAPIFDGRQGGPAGRDEGLPTLPANVRQAPPEPDAAAAPPSDPASGMDLVPLAALLVAVGGFALFMRWTRRPPGRRAESADLP
jgi:hypothetical protein